MSSSASQRLTGEPDRRGACRAWTASWEWQPQAGQADCRAGQQRPPQKAPHTWVQATLQACEVCTCVHAHVSVHECAEHPLGTSLTCPHALCDPGPPCPP